MAEHGMSERKACMASGIARSTLRYCHKQLDAAGVNQFMKTYMASNPRHGFDLLYAIASPGARRCCGVCTASSS